MTVFFLIILGIPIIIYATFIGYISLKVSGQDSIEPLKEFPKVSILIPCRDEESNISKCLESILKQTYDSSYFEVIVIDDFSSDTTIEIANTYLDSLYLTVLSVKSGGKKLALNAGIEKSKYPLILTLDADCEVGEEWLSSMLAEFTNKNLKMLCGPVKLRTDSSVFSHLQSAESAAIIGISAVMLNAKKPCTCNGANMLYRKDIFFKIGGYGHQLHVSSGDDDLLMQRFYDFDFRTTRYTLNKKTFVYTSTCKGVIDFFKQRLRWASKSKLYFYLYNVFVQALVVAHLLAFWLSVYLLVFEQNWWFLILIGIKLTIDFIYSSKLNKIFNTKLYLVIIMPIYLMYSVLVLILSNFIVPEWKGRPIKKKNR
ncbi:MAG: glycosyltransferase [Bacteroidia bacterium]